MEMGRVPSGNGQTKICRSLPVQQQVCNSKCATASEQTKAALQGGVHPKVEMAKTSACKSLCVQLNVSKHMLDTQKGET